MQSQAPVTNWTQISQARFLPSDDSFRRGVLNQIAERYHVPVRAMMRGWGLRDDHELDDAVQDFFVKFLEKNWLDLLSREKGRFRGFLRASVNHFLLDRRRARKPAAAPLPEADLLPSSEPTPDEIFDRVWARQLLAEAVEDFHRECARRSVPHYWTVFERHVLDDGPRPPSLKDTAGRLGVDEKDAANYLYRARRLFSDRMREAIRQTVSGTEKDVQAELEHLRRHVL